MRNFMAILFLMGAVVHGQNETSSDCKVYIFGNIKDQCASAQTNVDYGICVLKKSGVMTEDGKVEENNVSKVLKRHFKTAGLLAQVANIAKNCTRAVVAETAEHQLMTGFFTCLLQEGFKQLVHQENC